MQHCNLPNLKEKKFCELHKPSGQGMNLSFWQRFKEHANLWINYFLWIIAQNLLECQHALLCPQFKIHNSLNRIIFNGYWTTVNVGTWSNCRALEQKQMGDTVASMHGYLSHTCCYQLQCAAVAAASDRVVRCALQLRVLQQVVAVHSAAVALQTAAAAVWTATAAAALRWWNM